MNEAQRPKVDRWHFDIDADPAARRTLNTVLAGLRVLQRHDTDTRTATERATRRYIRGPAFLQAQHDVREGALTDREIDALCEAINFGGIRGPRDLSPRQAVAVITGVKLWDDADPASFSDDVWMEIEAIAYDDADGEAWGHGAPLETDGPDGVEQMVEDLTEAVAEGTTTGLDIPDIDIAEHGEAAGVYDVEVKITVTKTYRVRASSQEQATAAAHEGAVAAQEDAKPESYEQETGEVRCVDVVREHAEPEPTP